MCVCSETSTLQPSRRTNTAAFSNVMGDTSSVAYIYATVQNWGGGDSMFYFYLKGNAFLIKDALNLQ